MSRQQKDYTFDYELRLKDAGLIAASAAAQVGGAAKILDLGLARVDAVVLVDTTAVEVATGDERYLIMAQFSNSASFASGVVNGPALNLGDSSVTLASADSGAAERHELKVTNEINGTLYRYMRLYTVVQGTIATGINYTANLMKD
jgi:hypothetical protein